MAVKDFPAAATLLGQTRRFILNFAVIITWSFLLLPARAQVPAGMQRTRFEPFPSALTHPQSPGERFMMASSLLEDELEFSVDMARLLQPELPEPSVSGSSTSEPSASSNASSATAADAAVLTGLGSVPDMYGDFFSRGSFAFSTCDCVQGTGQYPQLGSVKIGENSSALPRNRFYFIYQHYNQALNFSLTNPASPPAYRSVPFDRYVLGTERTWNDGVWSAEIRVPFSGVAGATFTDGFTANNGNAGNLAVIVKRLLYQSEYSVIAAGVGVSLPTGANAQFTIDDCQLTVNNRSPKLQPFIGVLRTFNTRAFFQGFLQLDVAAAGNDVTLQTAANRFVPQVVGRLSERSYLFLDASAGYWLYRAPRARFITGLAAVAEVHYNAGLDRADNLSVSTAKTQFRFGPQTSSLNIVNGTVGIHFELFGRTVLRAAAVVPLTDQRNRSFNNEFSISVNHRY